MYTLLSKEKRDNFRDTLINHIKNDDRFYFYPNSENIIVNIHGEVKNVKTNLTYKYRKNSNGYLFLNIKLLNGDKKFAAVHRIVAETFLAYLPPEYYEVNHINGNKEDNSISNLEWVTRKENLKHSKDKKLSNPPRGINSPKCKLSFKDVEDIRELKKLGFTNANIGIAYNINTAYIRSIVNYRSRINE